MAEVTGVAQLGRKRARPRRTKLNLVPWLFLLPALIIYLSLVVYPMFESFILSLQEWEGMSDVRTYIGLRNYRVLFTQDPVFRLALRNNLIWIVYNLTIPNVAGLLLAIALNGKVRGKTVFRTIFYGPAILPFVGVGIMWAWMFNPNFGIFNVLLEAVGLKPSPWLGDPTMAMVAILIAATWQRIGFPMVLYLAGLQSIPGEQYEAAEIDGASHVQSFWYITMPMLRETHVIVISLGVIASLKVFDLVYSMTWGGPGNATQVLGTWMYFNTFNFFHHGLGSAIAWVIAAITMVVTFPYIRLMSRR